MSLEEQCFLFKKKKNDNNKQVINKGLKYQTSFIYNNVDFHLLLQSPNMLQYLIILSLI